VHGDKAREIELCRGDLTDLSIQDRVDILVVSAYPDDYTASSASLLGALNRRGISVEQLAKSKRIDLRSAFNCWLSQEIGQSTHSEVGFDRILCFEPPVFGKPPEVVGDIFRSLAPFLIGEHPEAKIAMPVVASGDQGWPADEMLRHMLDAAVHWLRQGLPISTLKIVERSSQKADHLRSVFASFRENSARPAHADRSVLKHDVFVSYSHLDSQYAHGFARMIREQHKNARIFVDQMSLNPGRSWQQEIYESLEASAKIVALLSPGYLESKICKEEFNIALCRVRESARNLLVPIYLSTANLPTYMKLIQYIDCRERDMEKLRGASTTIL
jgi:hypothetical protein